RGEREAFHKAEGSSWEATHRVEVAIDRHFCKMGERFGKLVERRRARLSLAWYQERLEGESGHGLHQRPPFMPKRHLSFTEPGCLQIHCHHSPSMVYPEEEH